MCVLAGLCGVARLLTYSPRFKFWHALCGRAYAVPIEILVIGYAPLGRLDTEPGGVRSTMLPSIEHIVLYLIGFVAVVHAAGFLAVVTIHTAKMILRELKK